LFILYLIIFYTKYIKSSRKKAINQILDHLIKRLPFTSFTAKFTQLFWNKVLTICPLAVWLLCRKSLFEHSSFYCYCRLLATPASRVIEQEICKLILIFFWVNGILGNASAGAFVMFFSENASSKLINHLKTVTGSRRHLLR